jgi:hypothetical protein
MQPGIGKAKPTKGLMASFHKSIEAKDKRNTNQHITNEFVKFAIDDSELGNTTDGKILTGNNTATAHT